MPHQDSSLHSSPASRAEANAQIVAPHNATRSVSMVAAAAVSKTRIAPYNAKQPVLMLAAATDVVATSSPGDPALPSLLDLPGELRNRILDLLFQFEEPVCLQLSHIKEAALIEPYPIQGIGLLYTCRQLRDEAATILYMDNTFAFGVACSKPVAATGVWLEQIGNFQRQYVRRINIELCLGDFLYDPAFIGFDLTCLLKPEVSVHNLPNLQFTFIRRCLDFELTKGHPLSLQVGAFEKIMKALTSKLPADLRTWMRSWRSISKIGIDFSGGPAQLVVDLIFDNFWNDPYERSRRPRGVYYRLSSEGELRKIPPKRPGLHDLVYIPGFAALLVNHLSLGQAPIVYDLDQKLCLGKFPAFLQIDHRTRRDFKQLYFSRQRAFLQLTTKSPLVAFGDFRALKDIFANQDGSRRDHPSVMPGSGTYQVDVKLDFNFPMVDVEMNAIDLLTAIPKSDSARCLHLSFQGVTMPPLNIYTLRKRLFVFSTELMRTTPRHYFSPLRTITMDAYGRMHKAHFLAVDGSEEVISNIDIDIDGDYLYLAGCEAHKTLNHIKQELLSQGDDYLGYKRTTCLLGLTQSLLRW